ncbi:hypothetical protein O1M63_43600 [Streptomyces mirabilis]|nr:hypothetical protein [Streptomyces mirabilis]
MQRLQITRETVLELAAENGAPLPEPLPPGYSEVLAAFEQAGRGLRARDVCQALDIGLEPRSARSSWVRRSRKSVSTLWWKPGSSSSIARAYLKSIRHRTASAA